MRESSSIGENQAPMLLLGLRERETSFRQGKYSLTDWGQHKVGQWHLVSKPPGVEGWPGDEVDKGRLPKDLTETLAFHITHQSLACRGPPGSGRAFNSKKRRGFRIFGVGRQGEERIPTLPLQRQDPRRNKFLYTSVPYYKYTLYTK